MKKILVFHPIIAPYRIDFFNSLSERYDARICLLWRNLKDQTFDYRKIEEQFRFTPEYVVREEIGFWKWVRTIWKMISSATPDMVLTSEFGVITILVLLHRFLTRSRHKVVTINDDSYDMIANHNQFTKRHARAVKMMMPLVDEVINVEPRVAAYNQSKYGKGVYFPIICDDNIARERLRGVMPISQGYMEKYRLEGKRVLLFVGRLVALKNMEFALRAFIKADLPDAVFVIVGDGPEKEKLENAASGRPSVIFTGRLEGDELYAWYNVAQTFILPSYQEPFGAVTNEALVAGCKALVSRNAGSSCLVKEGVNGRVVDPNDEEGLVADIRDMLGDIQPLVKPLSVKKNLMNETFEDNIRRLFKHLEAV